MTSSDTNTATTASRATYDMAYLESLRAQRLLNLFACPFDPDLVGADYSREAQYSNAWDQHPVLLETRGLILHRDGTVVARPYKKFFNVLERPDTQIEVLPRDLPEVAHKLDGSMLTLIRSCATGRFHFSTRGSFTSEQATNATLLWRDRYEGTPVEEEIDPTKTYVFEWISPDNRIVVHYGDRREMVMIGLIDTATGHEHSYADVRIEAARVGLPVVDMEDVSDWHDLLTLARSNFEGFVLSWPDRQVRVKVKLEEYRAYHRAVFGLSEKRVWETLSSGEDILALRAMLPEEHHAWLDRTVTVYAARYFAVEFAVDAALRDLKKRGLDLGSTDRAVRGEVARAIIADYPAIKGFVLMASKGERTPELTWRSLKPVNGGRTAVNPDLAEG